MSIAIYKLGRDDLAGLANLHFIRHVAGVDGGARGARGGGVEFAVQVFGDDEDLAHGCLRCFM